MKSTSTQSVTNKRVPQRTCIACRQVTGKRELIRLVHTPEGNIEIDTTGKKAGRGAYLHPLRECWESVLKGKRLEHALRGRLSLESREQLLNYGWTLPKGAS